MHTVCHTFVTCIRDVRPASMRIEDDTEKKLAEQAEHLTSRTAACTIVVLFLLVGLAVWGVLIHQP